MIRRVLATLLPLCLLCTAQPSESEIAEIDTRGDGGFRVVFVYVASEHCGCKDHGHHTDPLQIDDPYHGQLNGPSHWPAEDLEDRLGGTGRIGVRPIRRDM